MARGERGEARIGYPLTATSLTSSRGVWVICQNTSNTHTHTPLPLLSTSNYHRHQYFRISVHCVCRFCPVFQLPPAALPPFTIQTASLRSSALRHEGGYNVRCASGPAWQPPPTLAQHLGGINFLPLAAPTLLYCRPSRPSSVHRSKGQQGHVSSFLSCVLAVFLPPSGFPTLDPVIIHTSKSSPFLQM